MFCKICGKDIVGSNKCLYCGTPLPNAYQNPSTAPQPAENYADMAEEAYEQSNKLQEIDAFWSEFTQTDRAYRTQSIGIPVFLLATLVGGVLWFWQAPDTFKDFFDFSKIGSDMTLFSGFFCWLGLYFLTLTISLIRPMASCAKKLQKSQIDILPIIPPNRPLLELLFADKNELKQNKKYQPLIGAAYVVEEPKLIRSYYGMGILFSLLLPAYGIFFAILSLLDDRSLDSWLESALIIIMFVTSILLLVGVIFVFRILYNISKRLKHAKEKLERKKSDAIEKRIAEAAAAKVAQSRPIAEATPAPTAPDIVETSPADTAPTVPPQEPTQVYCCQCGKRIPDHAAFCPFCGTKTNK